MIEFKLPELGENIDQAEVIRVLVKEGDAVKAEQSVLEIESEKAAMALPAPRAGLVAKVHVQEGDSVKVGQALLSIEESGDGAAKEPKEKSEAKDKVPAKAEQAKEKKPESKEAVEAPQPAREQDGEPARKPAAPVEKEDESRTPLAAGPATRRLARELGVELAEVAGSGPGGRITQEDVQAAVRNRSAGGRSEAPALPDFGIWGPVERQALNAIGRTSAQRLTLAWQLVPHVTQHGLADITELEAARRRLEVETVAQASSLVRSAEGQARTLAPREGQAAEGQARTLAPRGDGSVKITVTALAIKAAVVALKAFPQVNSSYDAGRQELILKRYYHIGVAVDTKHGLLVPVIRDADQKSVRAISAELAELAEKARNRALSAEQMQGGTFTISNLGGIGGTAFTPIINYPEVAILGISRGQQQLVQRGEKIESRLMLPLSLSYDHRVVNGADGARFVTKLAELLGDPVALLVEICSAAFCW